MKKSIQICIMGVLACAISVLLNGNLIYLTDSGGIGIGIIPVVVMCATSGLVYEKIGVSRNE